MEAIDRIRELEAVAIQLEAENKQLKELLSDIKTKTDYSMEEYQTTGVGDSPWLPVGLMLRIYEALKGGE